MTIANRFTRDRTPQVAADMVVSAPLVYFPFYFLIKGLFAGQGPRASMRDYLSRTGMTLLRTPPPSESLLPSPRSRAPVAA